MSSSLIRLRGLIQLNHNYYHSGTRRWLSIPTRSDATLRCVAAHRRWASGTVATSDDQSGAQVKGSDDLFSSTLAELDEEKGDAEAGTASVSRRARKRLHSTRAQGPRSLTRRIKLSHIKLGLVARQVRGMSYDDAAVQLRFSRKTKAATYIRVALDSARWNAENQYSMDPSRLWIKRIEVSRDKTLKGLIRHSRGRMARKNIRRSILNIELEERDAISRRAQRDRQQQGDALDTQEEEEDLVELLQSKRVR